MERGSLVYMWETLLIVERERWFLYSRRGEFCLHPLGDEKWKDLLTCPLDGGCLLSVCSPCCCSSKENCCGAPHPPHQNVEVSDPPKPDSTGLGGRASLLLLPRTPASPRPQGRRHHRPGCFAFPAVLATQPSYGKVNGAILFGCETSHEGFGSNATFPDGF